uniref:ABC transporter permease n=1 Tax=Heterorhabditis bacteriophora TaxID=37862 RepID=A0A1I7WLZ6_HETBA
MPQVLRISLMLTVLFDAVLDSAFI